MHGILYWYPITLARGSINSRLESHEWKECNNIDPPSVVGRSMILTQSTGCCGFQLNPIALNWIFILRILAQGLCYCQNRTKGHKLD